MGFGIFSMFSTREGRTRAQVFQAWLQYDPGGQIAYERAVHAMRLLVEQVIPPFR